MTATSYILLAHLLVLVICGMSLQYRLQDDGLNNTLDEEFHHHSNLPAIREQALITLRNFTAHVGPARPPRVYFLFLAVDKVANLDIWITFFNKAPATHFRAFFHCKKSVCKKSLKGVRFFHVVQTVPSSYCNDLVSPMNQLLVNALTHDVDAPNQMDKFVFVSDSTLPAKPFSHVYDTLVTREGSDFCIFPSVEWAAVSGKSGLEVAVKHHQWIVLERNHAHQAAQFWAGGTLRDLMVRFHMNKGWFRRKPSFGDHANYGCLDEFWHMAVLYGTLSHVNADDEQFVNLGMFTGAPLHISAHAGWQGACDTFVNWAKYLYLPGKNNFAEFHSSLDQASIPHGGSDQRPGWWDSISTIGIRAIRSSNFLFVRKFVDNPVLVDGSNFKDRYMQIVIN